MSLHSINQEQRLYVQKAGEGFTTLGFDVLKERSLALYAELSGRGVLVDPPPEAVGCVKSFKYYQSILEAAREEHARTGKPFECGLTKQLKGLEGKRVEVVTSWGEVARFYVGVSTGFIPCHLEILRRNSTGGMSVCGAPFQRVTVLSNRPI